MLAARQQIKAYSLEMLGVGRKSGGGLHVHKTRMEVMERLRRVAALSPQQTADWEYFKTTWDKTMATATEEDWAEMFAEIVQNIVNELTVGTTNALSEFMHRETQRVLGKIPALMALGAP